MLLFSHQVATLLMLGEQQIRMMSGVSHRLVTNFRHQTQGNIQIIHRHFIQSVRSSRVIAQSLPNGQFILFQTWQSTLTQLDIFLCSCFVVCIIWSKMLGAYRVATTSGQLMEQWTKSMFHVINMRQTWQQLITEDLSPEDLPHSEALNLLSNINTSTTHSQENSLDKKWLAWSLISFSSTMSSITILSRTVTMQMMRMKE